MKITRKEKAIELLKELDIYKPYIEGFSNENKVCFFEEFGGFWVEQEPEIYEKMKEIENIYNCLVYAIIRRHSTKFCNAMGKTTKNRTQPF